MEWHDSFSLGKDLFLVLGGISLCKNAFFSRRCERMPHIFTTGSCQANLRISHQGLLHLPPETEAQVLPLVAASPPSHHGAER